ncbi:MAG: exopolysaccharide biosynthesis polyprenyl glycosylphosphotransferase [Kiritimatiellae bacterium]|nr:exopolysaccharide biosynthesis polyprenyl glycosylphosphotransferase [Kiritimatiellia bacterium]
MALSWRNSIILLLGDAAVIALALLAGRGLIFWLEGGPLLARYSLLLIPGWWIGAAAAGLYPSWGLGTIEEMRRIQLLLISVFALGGLAYFFGRGHFYPSRLAYVVAWMCATAGIPLIRAGLKGLLARRQIWGCPVALYGDRATVEAVAESLRGQPDIGYSPIGVFTADASRGDRIAGLPVLGGLDDRTSAAEVAIASMAPGNGRSLADQFDHVLSVYPQVFLLPGTDVDLFVWGRPRVFGSLVGMEVTSNLLNPFARTIKRGVDIFLVALTIPIWLPLVLLIVLILALAGGGSVFYYQERLGRKGIRFHPLKFRTMQPDSDSVLQKSLERDPALRAEWEMNHKLKDDPRVTRIGRFLRRWSLDELPQLWNVLAGHMSLVGPRPLPEDHFQQLHETTRRLRERVRPGMTGLWQVSGRSDAGNAGLERWDSYYVRNWSIWLDLVILIRTLRAVRTGQGAY